MSDARGRDEGRADERPAGGDVVSTVARAYERDRYLAALLAPGRHRHALLTIAAFAGDVARIPAFVQEPMMGEIRLQWWRDTIAAFPAGLASGHPVADALARVQRDYGLPIGLLGGFVDAQEAGLYPDPPVDDVALFAHLAKTEGALFELAGYIVAGASATAEAHEAFAAAGRAYGLARLLLELPILTGEGRTLLPATRLTAAGITPELLYAGQADDGLGDIVTGLAREARRAAAGMRAALATVPSAARPALWPAALIEPYLRLSQSRGRDAARDVADILPLSRVLRVWWVATTGRF